MRMTEESDTLPSQLIYKNLLGVRFATGSGKVYLAGRPKYLILSVLSRCHKQYNAIVSNYGLVRSRRGPRSVS